jgi:hypothetical protein
MSPPSPLHHLFLCPTFVHPSPSSSTDNPQALESGIDATAANKFPGSSTTYGSAATGRKIPFEQGGGQQRGTGRMMKDADFAKGAGVAGPEDLARRRAEEEPGSDNIRRYVGNENNREKMREGMIREKRGFVAKVPQS